MGRVYLRRRVYSALYSKHIGCHYFQMFRNYLDTVHMTRWYTDDRTLSCSKMSNSECKVWQVHTYRELMFELIRGQSVNKHAMNEHLFKLIVKVQINVSFICTPTNSLVVWQASIHKMKAQQLDHSIKSLRSTPFHISLIFQIQIIDQVPLMRSPEIMIIRPMIQCLTWALCGTDLFKVFLKTQHFKIQIPPRLHRCLNKHDNKTLRKKSTNHKIPMIISCHL